MVFSDYGDLMNYLISNVKLKIKQTNKYCRITIKKKLNTEKKYEYKNKMSSHYKTLPYRVNLNFLIQYLFLFLTHYYYYYYYSDAINILRLHYMLTVLL